MGVNLNKFVKDIFRTKTLQQSAVTFSGTFINGALGAIFYILSARFLGPYSFGLMMLAITALTLIADISDLGTNTGLVRFVAKYISVDKPKAYRFLKLGLKVKIFILLVVAILGYFVAPFVSVQIFSKSELILPLRIAFLGVSSALIFTFTTSTLQALEKFWAWSGIQIATNFLRLILAFILLRIGQLTTISNLIVYILVPFLGFIFGMKIIKLEFLKIRKENSVAKEFFHYNKWVAAFSLVSALGSRMDTFISGRLLTSAQLGIYSAANQVVQVVPQLVVALDTVVAPKMAAMGSIKELVSYMKKVQVLVLCLALLGAMAIPLVVFLLPVIYGPSYTSSIPVFVVLILAMLVFFISVPVHMSIFYYFARPSLFFWLSLAHLILVSVLSWELILSFGVIGAALAVLAGQIFNFVIPLVWVVRKINQPSTINH